MEVKPIANVKSPSKSNYYKSRNGNGFSLSEIKKAGKSVQLLKELGVKIDFFRKSTHNFNVEKLKSLKSVEKKTKKRESFVKKEKKRTPFKPEPPKKKRTKSAKKITPKKKQISKTRIEVVKEPKELIEKKFDEGKKLAKEDIKIKMEDVQKVSEEAIKKEKKKGGTPLTQLTGLGLTTAKKFESIGVSSIEELIKKNPEELAKLIKGASAVRIDTWIKEGQELLK